MDTLSISQTSGVISDLLSQFDLWPSFLLGVLSGVVGNLLTLWIISMFKGKKPRVNISISGEKVKYSQTGQYKGPKSREFAETFMSHATLFNDT